MTSRALFATTAVLLLLWAGSWGLSAIDLGRASLVVALGIAAAKATVVSLVFMELLHLRGSIRLIAAAAVAMLALLVGMVVLDVTAS
jgi:caa(3)-type oxidase subunit IV